MSITTSGAAKGLDIGQTLQDTLNVLGRNLWPMAILGLVLSGAPQAITSIGRDLTPQHPIFALLGLVGVVASLIGRPILLGAVVVMSVRDLDGEPISLRDGLSAGTRRWGSVLGLLIVTGLAIGVGLVLLIVPGVFLALKWAVALPSKVLTGRSISESMAHSSALTQGRRWAILLLYLIAFLLVVVLAVVAGVVAVGLDAVAPKVLSALLVTPLTTVIIEVPLAALTAVLYRRLRNDSEGAPTATLAEVFA